MFSALGGHVRNPAPGYTRKRSGCVRGPFWYQSRLTKSRETDGRYVARRPKLHANEEITMAKKTYKVGRSARTGRFTTVKKAQTKKSTHVVETIKRK